MEYELKRHGVIIPWDAIAKRLASEKDTTGACVQQHLSKLRKEMLARGSWVPPLSGKTSSKQQQPDVRGIVMVRKRNGECETREISWTEDAFKYVDLVHINHAKVIQHKKVSDDGEDTPGSTSRSLKAKRFASDAPDDEADPADLPSDRDFDPSNKNAKKAKRVTRSSAKSAGEFNLKSCHAKSEEGSDSDSDVSEKKGTPRKPVMMALYQHEEDELYAGRVILDAPRYILVQFPEGVNEAYRTTHAHRTGITDEQGEEMLDDNGPFHEANTAQNYLDAFAHGVGHSVMDANTPENYAEAFGNGPEHSMMDANTAENYADAFTGGYGHAAYEEDDSDSEFEEEQANADILNANTHMAQSNHMTGFPNSYDNMFGPALPVNQEHAGQGAFMGMSTPTSTSVQNASSQSAYGHNAVGPNIMGPDLLGQNHFNSNARIQDLFNGGPVNRPATDNFMTGQTFAQIIAARNAPSGGSGNGLGHGTSMSNGFVIGDTTNANDPFLSNEGRSNNPFGGPQTGISNNPGVPAITVENNPIDSNDTDLPMNDPGVNGSNGNSGAGTPRSSDAHAQVESYVDSFDVSQRRPLTITC
jgi:hypothetical protein